MGAAPENRGRWVGVRTVVDIEEERYIKDVVTAHIGHLPRSLAWWLTVIVNYWFV